MGDPARRNDHRVREPRSRPRRGGATHGGVRPIEQGEGDSFVIAFGRPSDAVACALDLQRAPFAPIRMRIGVHTGEVQLRESPTTSAPPSTAPHDPRSGTRWANGIVRHHRRFGTRPRSRTKRGWPISARMPCVTCPGPSVSSNSAIPTFAMSFRHCEQRKALDRIIFRHS